MKTQFEHMKLGAREEISFVENYSLVDIGIKSYSESVKVLEDIAKNKDVSAELFEKRKDFFPEILGSPRGYLKELITGVRLSAELEFPKESLTPEFEYYHSLISGGEYRADANTAFVIDVEYKNLILKKRKLTEFDYYILAIIDYANRNFDSSVEMIKKSLAIREHDYTLSAASLLALYIERDKPRAYKLAYEACRLNPEHFQPFAFMPRFVPLWENIMNLSTFTVTLLKR